MDIITYSLAKNKAKKYTDEVVEGLGRGILYKGAVSYYNDLPSNAAIGDCYSVLYEGTSGSTPSGAEYVWGKVNDAAAAEWIQLGKDIDLTDYVKNTDFATTSKAGIIRASNYYATVTDAAGGLYAGTYTYPQYLNAIDTCFISKGTLENVITGKGLVSNTDYASSSTSGVIKIAGWARTGIDNGVLTAVTTDYTTYSETANNAFISKGTLENVITGKGLTTKSYVDGLVGDIASVIDSINGEVI